MCIHGTNKGEHIYHSPFKIHDSSQSWITAWCNLWLQYYLTDELRISESLRFVDFARNVFLSINSEDTSMAKRSKIRWLILETRRFNNNHILSAFVWYRDRKVFPQEGDREEQKEVVNTLQRLRIPCRQTCMLSLCTHAILVIKYFERS